MLETLLPALQGLLTTAKAMASFDALRKGRKGDIRALIEELKENTRLCFRVLNESVDPGLVVPRLSSVEFDRLNKSGFNFNALKSARIPPFSGIEKTDLASWPGKTTAELVENIYDKIKSLKSLHEFKPEDPTIRRRIINVHKRLLLLLQHATGPAVVRPRVSRPGTKGS
jgi:hypothetical protein